MSEEVSKEQLLDDLSQFASDLGKVPTIREMREYGPHSGNIYQNKFGTWNKALDAAGFDPNVSHNITREEILADIERVAGVLGKTPTLVDMDDYGEFSKATYQNKLSSYVASLEDLGLEPTTVQYNFSDHDPPEHRAATKNVRKLRNDGPTAASDLPLNSTGVSDKQHGLTKFSINTGQTGEMQAEAVYYLFGEHDPEGVIRKFINVNPQLLEIRSRKPIVEEVGENGKQWSKAIRRVLDEFDIESR